MGRAPAQAGDPATLSGPGRGYAIDPDGVAFVLAGDESAIPAIGLLADVLPPTARATVIVEVARPDARLTMTDRTDVDVRWVDLPVEAAPGAALMPAVIEAEISVRHEGCGSPVRPLRCIASGTTSSTTAA